ncbi:mechanosensitive ion channel [Alcaligenaceae bacterium C4P045]|nr:mechanosensitive ion channel [Alcaligenaceae bacterium C4P045]
MREIANTTPNLPRNRIPVWAPFLFIVLLISSVCLWAPRAWAQADTAATSSGSPPSAQGNPASGTASATDPAHAAATASPGAGPASYGALADALENESSRRQLIEQLRTLAAGQPAATASAPGSAAHAQAAGAASPAVGASAGSPAAPAKGASATDKSVAAASNPQLTLPDEQGDASLGRRIADGTQAFVAGIALDVSEAIDTFKSLGSGGGARGVTWAQWTQALTSFAIVLLATVIAFAVLRALARLIFARLDVWVARGEDAPPAATHVGPLRDGDVIAPPPVDDALAGPVSPAHADTVAAAAAPRSSSRHRVFHARGWYRSAIAMGAAFLVDLAVVLLACLVGYGVGLFGTGRQGSIGTLDLFFINAFMAVEITKVLIRVVFATRYGHLRLLPMADDVATYWNRWLTVVVSLTGYGMLIVVPLVKAMFSAAVGQMLGLLIMLGVYIYAVRVIWGNRALIRHRLEARADRASTAFFGTLIRMLARVWHLAAIAYFTVLLVVSQVAPQDALPFMARATVQTLIAVAIGMLLSSILSFALSRPLRLSDDMRARLPMLEARLNAYVPATLKGVRMLILIAVVLVVFDAWQAFNLAVWIASEGGRATVSTVIHVAIILLVAALAWTVIASIIEHRLSVSSGKGAPSAREKTLLSLFRNAALIVIVTMTILILLSQIGIDIAPLIAGAGVVGLAIGFGAQKLVQDIITGVFIQLENGMNQNDVVEAAGVFGTVEKLTIRSVGIRTLDGGYHLIPFSSVTTVANHMRDFSYHLGEYTVAYRESVDDAMYHLEQAFEELKLDPVLAPEILEDMTIPGVTALNERGFTIRVLIKTTPGMQWAVQRGYNRLVKKHFNAANIELPYPHTVVYFGQDKRGAAPGANVNMMQAAGDHGDDRTLPSGSAAGRPSRVYAADNAAKHVAEDAAAPGHTPRPLTRASSSSAEDVLGNELDTVVDEDGEPREDVEKREPTRDGRSS